MQLSLRSMEFPPRSLPQQIETLPPKEGIPLSPAIYTVQHTASRFAILFFGDSNTVLTLFQPLVFLLG